MLFSRHDESTSKAKMYQMAGKNSASITEIIESLSHTENDAPLNTNPKENADAIALLESIQLFLHVTSIDFQEQRKSSNNDAKIKNLFEQTANAINTFQNNPSQNAFQLATLKYAIACLQQQLSTLQTMNDPIFAKYITLPNSLRNLIAALPNDTFVLSPR